MLSQFVSIVFFSMILAAEINGHRQQNSLKSEEFPLALSSLNSMLTASGLPVATGVISGTKQVANSKILYRLKFQTNAGEYCTASFSVEIRRYKRIVVPLPSGVSCSGIL